MARTVSKSEPEVVMVALPVCPGVKRYQTVLPMRTPEHRSGSPSSSVATVVSWAFVYGMGETVSALARWGWVAVWGVKGLERGFRSVLGVGVREGLRNEDRSGEGVVRGRGGVGGEGGQGGEGGNEHSGEP